MAAANVPRAPATAPDVIIDVNDRLAEFSSFLRPVGRRRELEKFTIFRVPLPMRKDKAGAFEPSVVSIGPFHRGKKELRAMEEHKGRLLNDFLSRRRTLSLDLLLAEMRPLESRARGSYCETVDLSSDEFLMMMVLDGCFLLELGLCFFEGGWTKVKKEVGWSRYYVASDILMLENQIPFFIIETLIKIYISQPEDEDDGGIINKSVRELDLKNWILSLAKSNEKTTMPNEFILTLMKRSLIFLLQDPSLERPTEVLHLLQLCHYYCVPSPNLEDPPPQSQVVDFESVTVIPHAAELQNAGIKIKKKEEALHFLDVTFDKTTGVLEIPPLILTYESKPLLLNLLAFEQCVGYTQFTTFVFFLDCLVNTTEDVLILEGTGVVSNWLSSEEEAAAFFNSLGQGMRVDDFDHYFAPVFRDINGYCRQRWNKYRAVLVRDYFGSPWALISVLAAFILLALSIIQTVFVLLSYYVPPK